MAELPGLGERCSLSTCGQLDFLPFACGWCGAVFCRRHFQPDAHGCPASAGTTTDPAGAATPDGGRSRAPRETCPVAACRAVIGVFRSSCRNCGVDFCLEHRFPDSHGCSGIEPTAAAGKMEKTKELVDEILKRQKGKPQVKAGRRDPALAAKVALMKLKQSAKGDAGLPVEERVYLSIKLPSASREGEAEPSPSLLAAFVSTHWSVGRAIDVVSELARLPEATSSSRNLPTRLGLFVVAQEEEGEPVDVELPPASKWGQLIEAGRVTNGGSIELRRLSRTS